MHTSLLVTIVTTLLVTLLIINLIQLFTVVLSTLLITSHPHRTLLIAHAIFAAHLVAFLAIPNASLVVSLSVALAIHLLAAFLVIRLAAFVVTLLVKRLIALVSSPSPSTLTVPKNASPCTFLNVRRAMFSVF